MIKGEDAHRRRPASAADTHKARITLRTSKMIPMPTSTHRLGARGFPSTASTHPATEGTPLR